MARCRAGDAGQVGAREDRAVRGEVVQDAGLYTYTLAAPVTPVERKGFLVVVEPRSTVSAGQDVQAEGTPRTRACFGGSTVPV